MNCLSRITVTDVLDVITVYSPKGRYQKMVNRKCYGLSFCAQGQITYIHNGQSYVSDTAHAVLLPKGQSYTIRGDKTGNFPVINFECADFLCDTPIVLPVSNGEFLIGLYQRMKNLIVFEQNRAEVMSLFYSLIHHLSLETVTGNVLLPAIKYLENNFSSPDLTNTALAERCNISEVYFRKLFVRQYGITPHQYIIDIRINKARQLLTDGLFKVQAVSEKCGFSNPYHFCRLFKEKTGLTPTQYSKLHKHIKI